MAPSGDSPLRIEARAAAGAPVTDHVWLTFEDRTRSRLVARLGSGVEATVLLPRGVVLRDGDRLQAADGRVVEVRAAPESLLDVAVAEPELLARAAYHLGNRHVAVALRPGGLRVARDTVIERLLRGLGLDPQPIDAPFEPEGGAYGPAHTHRGESGRLAPVIHEFRRP
jgi:urease accessory protein